MNSFGELLSISFEELHFEAGCFMVGRCANCWCPTTRHRHEGKPFRLDINLGSKAGQHERRTENSVHLALRTLRSGNALQGRCHRGHSYAAPHEEPSNVGSEQQRIIGGAGELKQLLRDGHYAAALRTSTRRGR